MPLQALGGGNMLYWVCTFYLGVAVAHDVLNGVRVIVFLIMVGPFDTKLVYWFDSCELLRAFERERSEGRGHHAGAAASGQCITCCAKKTFPRFPSTARIHPNPHDNTDALFETNDTAVAAIGHVQNGVLMGS